MNNEAIRFRRANHKFATIEIACDRNIWEAYQWAWKCEWKWMAISRITWTWRVERKKTLHQTCSSSKLFVLYDFAFASKPFFCVRLLHRHFLFFFYGNLSGRNVILHAIVSLFVAQKSCRFVWILRLYIWITMYWITSPCAWKSM